MKIAVIGTGISGLAAARTLAPSHDVHVFEADERLGGHAHTVEVDDDGKPLAIDTGFIVYNEANYPHLSALFDELGVATHASDMSFSVHAEANGLEWNGSSLGQVFAQRRNVLRPSHWRMLADILKFHKLAETALRDLSDQVSVREWARAQHFSRAFSDFYLLPLGASLWSCSAEHFATFPMRFVLEFLRNHHMLQLDGRPQWRTVTGGSREYVNRIIEPFATRIRMGTPVEHVRRVRGRVEVTAAGGSPEAFDEVIIACHADQALKLLDNPDETEAEVLRYFPYQRNVAVLHHDETLLPKRKRAWASWNFRVPAGETGEVNITYYMNFLQKLKSARHWCVTLNPGERVNPDCVARTMEYHHPLFIPGRAEAQSRHHELIRRDGISYCGAYWGFGFHEDGARSGLEVASAFGQTLRAAA